ncbi:hypothetical protein D3C84_657590 [compost metagenome]
MLQVLQAADQQLPARMVGEGLQAQHARLAFAQQGTIQTGPALLLHLPLQAALDLQLGARAEPLGGQFRGTVAHALGDVVAGDDQILAGVVLTAQDDVGVRVISVPVIDRHPVEAGAEVGFYPAHQVAGVGAQVVELLGILGRDDEAELVPVFPAPFLEGLHVGLVGERAVGLARIAFATHAVALDVAQVAERRAFTGLAQVHQARFDGDAAGVGGQLLRAETGGDMPAAETGARLVARLARLAGAGLVGLAQYLVNEGLAALFRRPRPGAEAFFSMLIAFLAHTDDSSKLIAVQRARHAVGSVWP